MTYKAPLDDMNFLLKDVFHIQKSLGDIEAFKDFDEDLYSAVLEESAKFSENVLFPINREGDEEGCSFVNGIVTTPKGFKEAYREYAQGGWQGLSGDPEFGGQGLPKMLNVLTEEMVYSTNTSFCLYSSLTSGAYHAIHAHASEELKATYLPAMLEGRWAGAMGLTESHAGSDLGIIKTKAQDSGGGSYLINGSKMFITGGDQDLTENIIHLVLAKLPGAPDGPQGISLFLVPKIMVNDDGSLGDANGVSCGSIEHKMGIKASATCVMNFDNAKGFLIGKENRGLYAMFTMMNLERLSIGIQGVGLAETSYQLSKNYALERKQGKNAKGEATTIIQHADVRRMILEQRAYTEAGRALAVYMGMQIDKQYHHPDQLEREKSEKRMAFLTPVAKAFFTDKGFDACNLGVQILGGHGFVREWGLEQLVRDAKIGQIYEGTNGIQAQDFMVRKICLDKQSMLSEIYSEIQISINRKCDLPEFKQIKQQLIDLKLEIDNTIDWMKDNFEIRGYDIQGGATQFLHAFGHLVFAWMWLELLHGTKHTENKLLVERKKVGAKFFSQHLLPQAFNLCQRVKMGYKDYIELDESLL